jgi:hypothetical protein
MQTFKTSDGSKIKAVISENLPVEQKQDRILEIIKSYREGHLMNFTCVGIVSELLGDSAHLNNEVARSMRSTLLDVLAFLADPEIAARFKEVRGYASADYAEHLKSLINFISDAQDISITAETAIYQLESWVSNEQDLRGLQYHFD